MLATFGIFVVMFIQVKQSGGYYQKTVRPFVYAHSLVVEKVNQPINFDSKIQLSYSLKNVGSLPAKEVRHSASYGKEPTEKFKALDPETFKWGSDKIEVISALYPNQELRGFRSSLKNPLTVQYLGDHKWVHVLLTYRDAGDRKYYHKWIVEARTSLKEGEFTFQALNKWVDFN